jgi:TIR domain
MDVFISWSGPQSKQVAEALHHYLPLMINAIQPWLSSADIEAGARWASDVAGKLQQSKVGIICLTPTNLESIWIHFEAGALAKTLDSTFVCPYLVGVEPADVKGPLTQFQAKRANEEDTKRLLETLNSALGENAVKADQLAEAFSMCWPKLKAQLDALQGDQPPVKKRDEREMLEELVELARSQARQAAVRDGHPFQFTTEMALSIADDILGEDVLTQIVEDSRLGLALAIFDRRHDKEIGRAGFPMSSSYMDLNVFHNAVRDIYSSFSSQARRKRSQESQPKQPSAPATRRALRRSR